MRNVYSVTKQSEYCCRILQCFFYAQVFSHDIKKQSVIKQEYALKRSLWYTIWGLTRVKKGTCRTFFKGWNYVHFDKISRLLFRNAYLCQNICSFSSCWFTNLGCWFAFFILFIIITTITQSFLDPLGPKICPKFSKNNPLVHRTEYVVYRRMLQFFA